MAVAQQGFGDVGGMAVDFEDGADEGVGDVSLEQPGFFVLFAI